ncbi:ABC transporter ATP-binding protein [Desnuesiella massiliensis]|uniref:ABC transporter ATP-binding protein n=1 Tax=Desnuesiella massiliensis TaxID=1650662 RepID=UPI0006E18ABA|nr:ABC transporter ATP-binding protein [Desnuesiella massiliensis]
MKRYLLKFKGSLLLGFLMVSMASVLNVYIAYVMKKLIDVATTNSTEEFIPVVLFTAGYLMLSAIAGFMLKLVVANYMKRTMSYMKNDIFSNILKKNIKDLNGENSGKYISVIANDIAIIEADYFNNIFSILNAAISFVLSIIYMFSLSYKIALWLITMTLLSMILPQIFGEKLSKYKGNYSNKLETFTSKVKDMLTGFEVIKSFNIEKKIENEYGKYNNEVEKSKFKLNVYTGIVNSLAELLGSLLFVVVFVIGIYLVLKGEITLGIMIACIQLTNNIANPVAMSIQYLNKIKSIKDIGNKILDLTKDNEIKAEGTLKKVFEEVIEFKTVSFGYKENSYNIKNINLVLEKGKKYALVGGSGGGKSTILRLMLRYYDNYQGNILMDGVDIRDISMDSLYKLQSVIHQNVFMFDGTIKDNITLYNEYSEEEIYRAINLSGLQTLISKLPKGIYNEVGEMGNLLSGGEKQRVAIARAIIKNTPIMILDEATSALDNETAYMLENTLLSMKDITSIVVTHKLWEEVLNKYDEIIVLKDGYIIEKGSFNELLNSKGYFYSMYYLENAKEENRESA